MLSRRVGHRRVHDAKRPGQRDAQPAEQLWQQLLGVVGERNVPRWLPHHLAQQLADLLGLLELVELAHSLLNALGDRKVLRHNHVTPVPLGRVARPAMAMSSICSSTNSRKRRTSFLSILILATERKNRSNTGIPDGWVTRYLLVHRSRLTSSTQG